MSHIGRTLKGPLPGWDAHREMVSDTHQNNAAARQRKPPKGARVKDSAVLLALYPVSGVPHTVFMLRPDYGGVHGNQIGLPGGAREHSDPSLQATALREAEEELGIPATEVELLGQLSPVYIPPSRNLVRPFVGHLPTRPDLVPDVKEVDKLIETPLDALLHPDSIDEQMVYIHMLGGECQVPCFVVDDHVIWGATAMMLAEFRRVVQGNR